jgi:hypothetical protein
MTDSRTPETFRNNEPTADIQGGDSRSSKLVDLERFDAIKRRQMINTKLLLRACGEPQIESAPTFENKDLELLVQIAREHDPNGNPIIRKHAVNALGQFSQLPALETLLEISTNDTEDESIRVQALISSAKISPQTAQILLPRHLKDRSSLVRQAAAYVLGRIGKASAKDVLTIMIKQELIRAYVHALMIHWN